MILSKCHGWYFVKRCLNSLSRSTAPNFRIVRTSLPQFEYVELNDYVRLPGISWWNKTSGQKLQCQWPRWWIAYSQTERLSSHQTHSSMHILIVTPGFRGFTTQSSMDEQSQSEKWSQHEQEWPLTMIGATCNPSDTFGKHDVSLA